MNTGRINAGKTAAIPVNAESTQPAPAPKTPAVKTAKDTYESTPPPNDITKLTQKINTADLKGVVQANQSANPTLNPQSGSRQEHYGTSGSLFNGPADRPNRFGVDLNPENDDLKQQLNQRTGLGFDPNRDLKTPDGDALSISTKDPLGISKPSNSDNAQIKQLQEENKRLKDQNDSGFQAMIALQNLQRAWDQLDKQNAYIEQKSKEADAMVKAAVEKAENAKKNPNPDAPDNSGGGPWDPLVNNLGSPMKIRQPFVDPQTEEQFGPSGVMKGRDQAVDPNPDADPNEGGAQRAILSSSDAVTDPTPDLDALLQNLNKLKGQ